MITVGQTLKLPFWPGTEPGKGDLIDYEVEKISPLKGMDETPLVTLIMHRNGQREKTNRGHFRRDTRTIGSIEADLEANLNHRVEKVGAERLLEDLKKYRDRMIESHLAGNFGRQYNSNEQQWAGVIHYLMDTLRELGCDPDGDLSDLYGFGYINETMKAREAA